MADQKTTKSKASQDFVPIKEIREGVVVLKNGSLRMVLMASSLNFALKSAEEQNAIILQYQNFLNSLDFTIQFLIQSKELNIEPYLNTLRRREKEQIDDLLKIQTKEYIEFVEEFVRATNIVNKSFYIVVPYDPPILETRQGNPISELLNKVLPQKKTTQQNEEDKFNEYKLQLEQRAETIIAGLSRCGVNTAPLNTEELIELFYTFYNPGEIEGVKIPQPQRQ